MTHSNKDRQGAIVEKAEKVLHYTNLLIEQCGSWLPAEEGNKAMEEEILNKNKKYKKM
jgi:hypothetical protein